MRATMIIAIVGRIGPYDVISDEALIWMRDRLQGTDEPRITVRTPDGHLECPIDTDTVRVVKLGDGRWSLQAEVEIGDIAGAPPAILEPRRGLELTAAERRHAFENAPRETV